MNDNAKKWVAALRSKEYEQTKGALHNQVGYCCLGVACDLYQSEVGDLSVEVHDNDHERITYYDNEGGILPPKVRDWLGLTDDSAVYREPYGMFSLVSANDSGRTFEEIADIVESQPPGLFVED